MRVYMRKILILALGLIIIFLGLAFVIGRNSKSINKQEAYFIIKQGTTIKDIGLQLSSKGIIKSSQFFVSYSKLKGYDKKILPGRYIIKNGTKLQDMLKKFGSGKSDFAVVTIPEGYTAYQIAGKLEENNLAGREKFLSIGVETLDKKGIIQNKRETFYPLEGYLFPDTYYIPYDKTPEEIGELMFKRFEGVFNEEMRQRARELNLSTSEVITIASMIEREAANDAERANISGVIYNRIKKGMPLQIDAAVIYAVTKGQKNILKITKKDLAYDSPYNTYKVKGLPPGPIACPGQPSIKAALYPENHDYLYYVLGDNNAHVFSRTYEEHVANVNKYLRK